MGVHIYTKMNATLIVLLAGLCMASAIPAKKVSPVLSYEQAMRAKGIGCDICTLVVTEIDKILVAADTEQAAIDAVEQLCAQLDSIFAGATAASMLWLKPTCPKSSKVLLPTNYLLLLSVEL